MQLLATNEDNFKMEVIFDKIISYYTVWHETLKAHLHCAMHRAIDRPIDRKRPDRTV